MIGQLFPDLDSDPVRRRHLVKRKYKNEERQDPKQLHDALANRSNGKSCLVGQGKLPFTVYLKRKKTYYSDNAFSFWKRHRL